MATAPRPKNQRRQRRIQVEIWIEAEAKGELYFQMAVNLSVGGAFFGKTFPLPVGTPVRLKFHLPGDPLQIECEAQTVSAKDLGMGVTFTRLNVRDKGRIERLIARHQQRAPAEE